jgi:hypothetical protein
MQNIPCEVRAYRKFSILRLQFLHLKQFAQKAWSPVRMARSSILFPQWLQLYVQLLHMSEPSPSRSRLASESRRVPHVLQRKQSMCHRFPAVVCQCYSMGWWSGLGGARGEPPCLEKECIPSSKALPSSRIYTSVVSLFEVFNEMIGLVLTSPHPLHGYTTSSWSSGDSGYPPGESISRAGAGCSGA